NPRPTDNSISATEAAWQRRGRQYVVYDDGLSPAINAAILLAKPLLLMGEPGTGKTILADRVAWALGLERPFVFNTKSTSLGKDLFYSYDALGRLYEVYNSSGSQHVSVKPNATGGAAIGYVRLSALGSAILKSMPLDEVPEEFRDQRGAAPAQRSVVIIDEIDKANRDFPNDLLHELDRGEFSIPEAGGIRLKENDDPDLKPIVIVTSNSEKSLPEAFLRRCIFHELKFPEDPQSFQRILSRIVVPQVLSRLGWPPEENGESRFKDPFLSDCFTFFQRIRKEFPLKAPATAELVDWIELLGRFGADPAAPLKESEQPFRRSMNALAKFADDMQQLETSWASFKASAPAK
ncbi:MAG: MoxR family ATPase, partial [Planctomycetaceae bacterium]|nr:MoxR family ATPase [Planctomycetaceae bacterium]